MKKEKNFGFIHIIISCVCIVRSIESGLKFDLRGHSKEIFNLKWTPTGPHSVNSDKPLFLCTASFDGTVKVRASLLLLLLALIVPKHDSHAPYQIH